jgi:hypothetical protein
MGSDLGFTDFESQAVNDVNGKISKSKIRPQLFANLRIEGI